MQRSKAAWVSPERKNSRMSEGLILLVDDAHTEWRANSGILEIILYFGNLITPRDFQIISWRCTHLYYYIHQYEMSCKQSTACLTNKKSNGWGIKGSCNFSKGKSQVWMRTYPRFRICCYLSPVLHWTWMHKLLSRVPGSRFYHTLITWKTRV